MISFSFGCVDPAAGIGVGVSGEESNAVRCEVFEMQAGALEQALQGLVGAEARFCDVASLLCDYP